MDSRYDQLSPVPPLTAITKNLIILCVAVYFIDFILTHLGVQIQGYYLKELLGLVPSLVKEKGWIWQFATYIFMHGHHLHLLLNMLILWYFGSEIELKLGRKQFLFYFLLCGIGAGLFNYSVNLLFSDVNRLSHPIIGASGAIFGVLAAYGIFFAERYFLVFFVFPMKAKYFVLLMALVELVTGVESNASDNIAHFAHIGGMFVGAIYIYLRYIQPKGPKSGQSKRDIEREKLKKQFTLIVNDKGQKEEKGPYWN
ncbi:MAG: rhomboid family intramembrane serine protease [Proteobacteria bacterium]|nr:rhomboid family intramembrane serine protease [Pseudomonadota bacterium]